MICNTKQSIYYSASSLYMFRVSTTPIIRSVQNWNYSLRYWSYFLCAATSLQRGQLATLEGGSCTVPEAIVLVLCTPDDGCGFHPQHVEWTCRIIDCFVLHLVRELLIWVKVCFSGSILYIILIFRSLTISSASISSPYLSLKGRDFFLLLRNLRSVNMHRPSRTGCYFCTILTKLEFWPTEF